MTYELIYQDCIDWMNNREEKSIECIITSPPYNLDIKYGTYQDSLPRESFLQWLNDVAIAMKRVLKDDGQLFLNVGYTNNDPWVAMDVAQVFRQHFILQNQFTWIKHLLLGDKTHGIYKPITSDRYESPTTESIFHFTKTGKVKIDRLSVGHCNKTHPVYPDLYSNERYERDQRRSIFKKMPMKDKDGKNIKDKDGKDVCFSSYREFEKNRTNDQKQELEDKFKQMLEKKPYNPDKKKSIGNAWYIPYVPIALMSKQMGESELGTTDSGRGGHPATFPEQLPDMCIKISGITKGSIVYDPFNGSGTTVLAALKNEMIGIGTDIDQEYLDFSKKRIEYAMKIPMEELVKNEITGDEKKPKKLKKKNLKNLTKEEKELEKIREAKETEKAIHEMM